MVISIKGYREWFWVPKPEQWPWAIDTETREDRAKVRAASWKSSSYGAADG